MLRRRFLDRLLFPALVAAACGGESSDLFDSSGNPTSSGGDHSSAGARPEPTGGKGTALAGGNGGAITPTGGRSSAGGSNAGSDDGGEPSEPSGGVSGGGGDGSGGSSAGGDGGGGAVAGEPQGGASGGAASGGSANGGVSEAGSGGKAVGGSGGRGGGAGGKASCTDSDGGGDQEERVRGTTQGTNGRFQDKCVDGDLVEYSCEVMVTPAPCLAASMSPGDADLRPARPIDTCRVPTGKVTERTVECGGRCEAGTCFSWCPTLDDEVLVERRTQSRVLITNLRTEDVYTCEISSESENFDCRGTAQGQTMSVFSATCTLDGLTIGTDSSDEPGVLACSYSCSYE